MDRIAFESAPDRDAVSQMTGGLRLRVEVVNLPDRIVIQNQLCSRQICLCTSLPRRRLRRRCSRC